MAITYLEMVGNESPGSFGTSLESGTAQAIYFIPAPYETQDLYDAITYILGDTAFPVTSGALNRTLPIAHPQWPWLFASSINKITGVGPFTVESAEPALEAPTLPQYALYNGAFITVSFAPRSYAVLSNASIQLEDGSYYDTSGSLTSFTYAPEWQRFTDYEIKPQFESITSQNGSMWSQSTTTAVNNANFTGQPRIYLPNSVLQFSWFGVPLRYIYSANSYITRWPGFINQNYWNGYSAGSLLYLNYAVTKYTPPVPQEVIANSGATTFSTEKLCNVTFNFLLTNRPSQNDFPSTPTNQNFIQAGHNLLPSFIDRQYHYFATTKGADGIASFYSCPYELLFTDCDAVGHL